MPWNNVDIFFWCWLVYWLRPCQTGGQFLLSRYQPKGVCVPRTVCLIIVISTIFSDLFIGNCQIVKYLISYSTMLNNFYSLEVVDRVSDTQFQVRKNVNYKNCRLKDFKTYLTHSFWYDRITVTIRVPLFQTMYSIEMSGVPRFRKYMEDMYYTQAPSRFPIHTAYIEVSLVGT